MTATAPKSLATGVGTSHCSYYDERIKEVEEHITIKNVPHITSFSGVKMIPMTDISVD